MTRKERIIADRYDLIEIENFLSKFVKYEKKYKYSQFTKKYLYNINDSNISIEMVTGLDDKIKQKEDIREINLYKNNFNKFSIEVENSLSMEHTFSKNIDDFNDYWHIVNYRISYKEKIDRKDVLNNIINFIIENSNEIEKIKIKREYKLRKLIDK